MIKQNKESEEWDNGYNAGYEQAKREVKQKQVPRKIEIKKDRKEVARIIKVNLPLMNKNKKMCQEVADAILCYLMGLIK